MKNRKDKPINKSSCRKIRGDMKIGKQNKAHGVTKKEFFAIV